MNGNVISRTSNLRREELEELIEVARAKLAARPTRGMSGIGDNFHRLGHFGDDYSEEEIVKIVLATTQESRAESPGEITWVGPEYDERRCKKGDEGRWARIL